MALLGVKHDYDEAGELTKTVEYDEDGKYVGEVKYSTDPDGSTVARAYDDKKELAWESVWKKDSNGNTIEVTEKKTNSEGELVLTKEEIYEYDADGNKVRFTKYNGLGEVIDEIVYDSEGRILEEYSGWPKYYYEYDKNGHLLPRLLRAHRRRRHSRPPDFDAERHRDFAPGISHERSPRQHCRHHPGKCDVLLPDRHLPQRSLLQVPQARRLQAGA